MKTWGMGDMGKKDDGDHRLPLSCVSVSDMEEGYSTMR